MEQSVLCHIECKGHINSNLPLDRVSSIVPCDEIVDLVIRTPSSPRQREGAGVQRPGQKRVSVGQRVRQGVGEGVGMCHVVVSVVGAVQDVEITVVVVVVVVHARLIMCRAL